MIIDFSIVSSEKISKSFVDLGISQFSEACAFVANLPYGRTNNRSDFERVLSEQKGTCSSKHALLNLLALENGHPEIELIVGIFLMSGETHPVLAPFLKEKGLQHIPEAHVYFRYKGDFYDFTTPKSDMNLLRKKVIREQRCEANQVIEWKPNIHKHYLEAWAKRQNIPYSLEELWAIRETCISLL